VNPSLNSRFARRRLAAAASLVLALIAAPAQGADPADVVLTDPAPLLSGLGYAPDIGGTWYQAPTIAGGQLTVEVTLQLPALAGAPKPGPVVVLWGMVAGVSDADFGDSTHALIGQPRASVVLPHCDDAGNCALRVGLGGPIAPALQAADLDTVINPTMGVWFTAVRTYSDADTVQVAEPFLVAGGNAGTLLDPGNTYGALNLSPTFQLDHAAALEIPGNEFFHAADAPYDWAGAVRLAIQDFVPPTSPEPIPINVWTPQRTGVRHLQIRATYDGPCPDDRMVVVQNPATKEVAAVIYVGGGTVLKADLAVRSDAEWVLSLRGSGGATISTTSIPASALDALISGNENCTTGKGLLEVSGVPSVVPNPTFTPGSAPSSSPTNPSGTTSGELPAFTVLVVALLAAAGLAGTFLILRRRRN
jgi:hypothetical protein